VVERELREAYLRKKTPRSLNARKIFEKWCECFKYSAHYSKEISEKENECINEINEYVNEPYSVDTWRAFIVRKLAAQDRVKKRIQLFESKFDQKTDYVKWNANVEREKRVAAYCATVGIDDDFDITEEFIDKNKYYFTSVCDKKGCDPEKLKAELLKQPYTGQEEYDV
ncbi:MAG: hypothetical protein IKF90_08850, partial [Parasporobacterium sp.]|nr:hypothetical protein [Parasporobacterium sp.]